MGDGIDKCIVLLVAPDLTNQESGIEDQAKDDEEKEDDPKNKQRHLAPVEDDPTDIERNCQRNETSSKRDEKRNRPTTTTTAPNSHIGIVKDGREEH
jgi:hypothetical protein